MNIKNIIFDIGGVLANPKIGHWFITQRRADKACVIKNINDKK